MIKEGFSELERLFHILIMKKMLNVNMKSKTSKEAEYEITEGFGKFTTRRCTVMISSALFESASMHFENNRFL